jgi:hypothetical protein
MVHNRSLVSGVRHGSVLAVDIGPVRQRFTAEPLSSPVPGEPAPELPSEPLLEPVRDDAPTHVRAEPAR